MNPICQHIYADPKDCRRLLLHDGRPVLAVVGGGHEHPFKRQELDQISTFVCASWNVSDDDTKTVIDQVAAELERATIKFPTWPTDPLHALAVLGEEFGELTKAALQLTYEPHKSNAADVRMEAIQTAAMALRFAMSLDTYEYLPGLQHAQAPMNVIKRGTAK